MAKRYLLVVCFALSCLSSASCQPTSASHEDIVLVSEYLIIQEKLSAAIVTPLGAVTKKISDLSVEEHGIVGGIALIESSLRMAQRGLREALPVVDSLIALIESPMLAEFLQSTRSLLVDGVAAVTESIEVMEEIDGSTYRFMARADEITASLKRVTVLATEVSSAEVEAEVYAAAHLLRGW